VNLAKVFDRIQKDVTSLSPVKIAKASLWIYQHLDSPRDGVAETSKLEVRIADDFDDLPKDVAEEFWADAFNGRSDAQLGHVEDV
jgi:hypothetical protein